MNDKSRELNSTIKLVNDKLHFVGIVGDNVPVSIDYIPPLGDDLGYTSLELLLLSFSSCLGSAILTFLRKMKKTITNCEIKASGQRREEHPTGFKSIHLEIIMESPDVTEDDMKKVVDLAEEKYCPVWSMIKGNTKIETTFTIK
ncbi:MAG: OsmC family peroxiredoxin [Ignavibacteriales bacterium]|nr:MAG: OsmC family peroxiredoxin [Ignavibacteriales bacterium]